MPTLLLDPLLPPWLKGQGTNAQKYMAVLEVAVNALLEKQNEGIAARLPGHADASAIPLWAADRLMVQGPAEPNDAFVQRLIGALAAWGLAGSRNAVMGQLHAYLQSLQPGVAVTLPEITIVGGNTAVTTWDQMFINTAIGAPPAHRLVDPSNWDWDGTQKPWRSWLVMFMHLVATGQSGTLANVIAAGIGSGVSGVTSGFARVQGLTGMSSTNLQQYLTVSGSAHATNNGTFQIVSIVSETKVIIANPTAVADGAETLTWSVGEYPFIGPAPVWGSPQFVWGQGTWGVNCSSLVIQSIRDIVKRWRSAGTHYPNIIISFGGGDGTAGNSYSPLNTITPGVRPSEQPNGDWGGIGKLVAGAWVPAKTSINAFDAFCEGTGEAIQCYEKNYG
jgi:hypothetical protein